MKKIGFIGAGKMAQALVAAILQAKLTPADSIICSDPVAPQRVKVAQQYAVRTTSDNRQVLQRSDIVFLACKPQNFPEAAAGLAEDVKPSHIVVSIMAGVRIARIRQYLPAKIVRVMPNTPCLVGAMAGAFSAAQDVSPEELKRVQVLLNSAGLAVPVPEEQLDAVTGLSGSGPAFIARLIEAFIAGGTAAGLSPDTARVLTLQTFSGTAQLLSQWQMQPQELVEMVSSPAGTTVAGREVLEASDLAEVIQQTILRATARSRELGR